jgi:hypothetical protein
MSTTSGSDVATPSYKVTIDGDGVKVSKEIDAETATEILAIVMGGGSPSRASHARASKSARSRRPRASKAKSDSTAPRRAKRKTGSPGVVKDLSMRPKGKKAFMDFVAEKQPATHQQKQAVALYWLRHEAGMSSGITSDHVNTCYLEADWPRPANLDNAMQVTAKVKGWFDTSDMANIQLTTRGEDEVKHKLPPPPKKK